MDKLIINGIVYVAQNSEPKQEHIERNKQSRVRRSKSRRAHLRRMAKVLKEYKSVCDSLLQENIELRYGLDGAAKKP